MVGADPEIGAAAVRRLSGGIQPCADGDGRARRCSN